MCFSKCWTVTWGGDSSSRTRGPPLPQADWRMSVYLVSRRSPPQPYLTQGELLLFWQWYFFDIIFFNLKLCGLTKVPSMLFCMSGDQTPQNQIGCHNQLLASSSWGIFQLLILGLRRVTLIAGLPPRLTSFWIISSQISSDFLKFSLKFSISSQPG